MKNITLLFLLLAALVLAFPAFAQQAAPKTMRATYAFQFPNVQLDDLGMERFHQMRFFWCQDSIRMESELFVDVDLLIIWTNAGIEFSRPIAAYGKNLKWVKKEFKSEANFPVSGDTNPITLEPLRRKVKVDRKRYKGSIVRYNNPEHDVMVAYQKNPEKSPLVYFFPFLQDLEGFPVMIEKLGGPDKGTKYILIELKEVENDGNLFTPGKFE